LKIDLGKENTNEKKRFFIFNNITIKIFTIYAKKKI